MTHEIQLIDESAICESSSFGKGILVFDATSPNPIDTLHITSNDLWNGLTITVAFEFKEFYEQVPMDHNGIVPVPNWVFNHSATSVCPGQIIFTGVAPNLRRIITSLPYVVNGVFIKPPQLYARWPIFSGASRSEFPDIGYSNVIYKAEDERALYQWDVNTSTYEQLVFLPSFADTNTTYKLELDPVDVHKIILYARDIGEEDWRNVGEIETADTVYDDQELRSAVEDVSMLVGNTPVAEQISSAIRALSVPDEAVAGQFITTVAQSDGKVAVSRRTLQESDVPALGMGKVNGLQDALDLKATTASVTAVDKKVTQLSGTVGTVQGSVTTLVGNDANKSVRTIANEELAAQLIPEGATEALDTLQEIAAWIQHHPNDAAALNSSIAALQAQLNGIETGNGTVKSYVDTAVQDLAQQVNQDIQEIELTPGPQGPQGEPGPTGPQGPPGADGQAGATGPAGADGQDGVSPTVTTETISGGTRVTITDASGAHEFDVMNGQNGAPGEKGDPGEPGADGQDGQNGQDGITPTIGENGNWFLGDTDTGKPSRGEIGLTGPVGPEGPPGAQGEPGRDGVQINDEAVSTTETWSSKKLLDTLCPPFAETGNPITCTPVEGYPLGAAVTLEPKQAGTGDPSPENVRPISGYDSVTVTQSKDEAQVKQITLDLPETIYGGTVDAISGNGSKEWECVEFDGTEKWQTWGVDNMTIGLTGFYYYVEIPVVENSADYLTCSHLVFSSSSYGGRVVGFQASITGEIYWIFTVPNQILTNTESSAAAVDSWKSYLATQAADGTPVTVSYKLATPEPFQATGNQPIPALAGENTLLTDGDTLTRIVALETAVQEHEEKINLILETIEQGGSVVPEPEPGQTGGVDDPIDAVRGMTYYKDKYYRDPDDGQVYKCFRDSDTEPGSGVALSYLPHELVNIYFYFERVS